jgi:hypothetical protein
MPYVDMVIFLDDVAATVLEVVAMAAVVDEVTSPTSRRIIFLPIYFVGRPIIWCSSATKDLIQPTWGKRRATTQQVRMV